MRLALLLPLLALAACDTTPAEDLDLGEFVGTVADARAGGFVLHDVAEAREAGAPTFAVRADLRAETGDMDYRPVYVVLRLPLGETVEAGEFEVTGADAAVAQIVEYAEDGAVTVLETATAGTVGLLRPEHQDRAWFRVFGTVDLAFPSGDIVGTFRATPRTGHPVSGCNAFGCTDY